MSKVNVSKQAKKLVAKAKKQKVVAHKSYMTVNRQNVKNTVVAFLPPIKNSEGSKTGYGNMLVVNTTDGTLAKPVAIKMLYGKQAQTFKNITEVITPSSYKKGNKKEYSYKYVVTKTEYQKQNQ